MVLHKTQLYGRVSCVNLILRQFLFGLMIGGVFLFLCLRNLNWEEVRDVNSADCLRVAKANLSYGKVILTLCTKLKIAASNVKKLT